MINQWQDLFHAGDVDQRYVPSHRHMAFEAYNCSTLQLQLMSAC